MYLCYANVIATLIVFCTPSISTDNMSKKYLIQNSPFVVPTTDGKLIEEHFGNATNGDSSISIAHMVAPPGWSEPFQTPEFDEYTYIIRGKKQFIIDEETVILEAGQSIKIKKNTRIQYSNAFSMDLVHREEG